MPGDRIAGVSPAMQRRSEERELSFRLLAFAPDSRVAFDSQPRVEVCDGSADVGVRRRGNEVRAVTGPGDRERRICRANAPHVKGAQGQDIEHARALSRFFPEAIGHARFGLQRGLSALRLTSFVPLCVSGPDQTVACQFVPIIRTMRLRRSLVVCAENGGQ